MVTSKKSMYQYYRAFTLKRNESNISVEENTLKINQYYFQTFPISKVTRKEHKSNRIKFLEASLTEEKFTKMKSKHL